MLCELKLLLCSTAPHYNTQARQGVAQHTVQHTIPPTFARCSSCPAVLKRCQILSKRRIKKPFLL